jgi:hypothetical protein
MNCSWPPVRQTFDTTVECSAGIAGAREVTPYRFLKKIFNALLAHEFALAFPRENVLE